MLGGSWKDRSIPNPIYTILTSGLRQGEAISLLWAAFDMRAQRLCLRKRWIQLAPKQSGILASEHDKHPESPLVFLDERNGAPFTEQRLYYLHRTILKQSGLPGISLRELQASAKELRL